MKRRTAVLVALGVVLGASAITLGLLYHYGVIGGDRVTAINLPSETGAPIPTTNAPMLGNRGIGAPIVGSAPSVGTRSFHASSDAEDEDVSALSAASAPKSVIKESHPGFGRVAWAGEALAIYSDNHTNYYRADEQVMSRPGLWWGLVGVHNGSALSIPTLDGQSKLLFSDPTLAFPVWSNAEEAIFAHANAITHYNHDTGERRYVYKGDMKVVGAFVDEIDSRMVVLFDKELRTYVITDNGVSLVAQSACEGGVALAPMTGGSCVGKKGFVEVRGPASDASLVHVQQQTVTALIRPPEPAASFGESVAYQSGILYVGAPQQRTVYSFARVGDMWLPHGAHHVESPGFGRSVECVNDTLYIGAARVYVF